MTLDRATRVQDALRPHVAPHEEIAVYDTVLADFSIGFPHMFVKAPLHWADLEDAAKLTRTLTSLRDLRRTFAQNARARAAEEDTIKGLWPLSGVDCKIEAEDAMTGKPVLADAKHMLPADIVGAEIAALLWEERFGTK